MPTKSVAAPTREARRAAVVPRERVLVRVRKSVVMDQRKLDAARRALAVETETEAIDLALDFVAFRREVAEGLAAM